jgi:non-specific serine/threonine protein kinase
LEIVRQYAGEKLKAFGEHGALRDRHLDWFRNLVDQARPELFGPQQARWMARLEQEQGNLRAALGWSLDAPHRIEAGSRAASSLVQFWQLRGDFAEGLAWLDLFLEHSAHLEPQLRAVLLEAKGFLAFHWSAFDVAGPIIEQAAVRFEAAGDLRGVGRQLHLLAQVALGLGDTRQARDFAARGLEIHRAAGDKWWTSACLFALGDSAFLEHDVDRARTCYRESLALVQDLGHAFAIARRLVRLGQITRVQGDFAQAHAHLAEGLALARRVGDNWGVTMAMAGMGALAVAQGSPASGARLLGATEARLGEFGAHFWPLDRVEFERTFETLQALLTPDVLKANLSAGRALSLDQALAYALELANAGGSLAPAASAAVSKPPAGLTQRESEILRLIAAGESNQAIADALVISVRTVERHTANIYQKLGVAGPAARTAAANFAFRHGLVAPPAHAARPATSLPSGT